MSEHYQQALTNISGAPKQVSISIYFIDQVFRAHHSSIPQLWQKDYFQQLQETKLNAQNKILNLILRPDKG